MTVPSLKSIADLERLASQFEDNDRMKYNTLMVLVSESKRLATTETCMLDCVSKINAWTKELESALMTQRADVGYGSPQVYSKDLYGLGCVRMSQRETIRSLCVAVGLAPKQLSWLGMQ